jgi:molybdate-binding protein
VNFIAQAVYGFELGKLDLRCSLIPGDSHAEGRLSTRLSKRYKPWLNNGSHWLITVVGRTHGWMARDRDPTAGEMLSPLSNSKLRFVNYQTGSGTRLAFDQMTKDAGTDPQTIRGFETEEFTHLAVAAMLAGEAGTSHWAFTLQGHGLDSASSLHFPNAICSPCGEKL